MNEVQLPTCGCQYPNLGLGFCPVAAVFFLFCGTLTSGPFLKKIPKPNNGNIVSNLYDIKVTRFPDVTSMQVN